MIRLKRILQESAITDSITIAPVGRVTCKWDTGNTTRASALHAQDIQVDGEHVTWSFAGYEFTSKLHGYSDPRGKSPRPVIATTITWRNKRVPALVELVDRSSNTAEFLCNMQLMKKLGVQLDTANGQAYTND